MRLYPLHLVFLIAMLVIEVARNAILPLATGGVFVAAQPIDGAYGYNVALHVFLLQSTGLPAEFVLNVPSWSISAEIWAYLAFAFLCVIVRNPGLQRVVLCLTALSCALVLLRWNGPNGLQTQLEFGLVRCALSFSLGALAVGLYRHLKIRGIVLSVSVDVVFPLVVGALFVIAANMDALGPWNILALPVFVVTILMFALDTGSKTRAVLSANPFQSLGRWSYSIYMSHAAVTAVMGFAWNRVFESGDAQAQWWGTGYTLVYVAVVVVISRWTFAHIEQPWRARGAVLAASFGKASDVELVKL